MPEATAKSCANAFLRHWVRIFGLPSHASSDNGNTFVSQLWKDLHAKLGTVVNYSPLYRPAALGGCEREHKEIKHGLKAVLLEMGNTYQDRWMEVLPWILLSRHSVFQPALGASAAEAVFGEPVRIPGDLIETENGLNLDDLIHKLRLNAAKSPAPTRVPPKPVYWPSSAAKATHVYTEVAKKTPLGPQYDGPWPIEEKLGESCLKIRVGFYASGEPRFETVHWSNCQPAVVKPGAPEVSRPALGRRPKSKTKDT